MADMSIEERKRALEEKRRQEMLRQQQHIGNMMQTLNANMGTSMEPVRQSVTQQVSPPSMEPTEPEPVPQTQTPAVESQEQPVSQSVQSEPVKVQPESEPMAQPVAEPAPAQPQPEPEPVRQEQQPKPAPKRDTTSTAVRTKQKTEGLQSDPFDVKQVRSVYNVAVEIAMKQFPGASLGDAVSAFIIANSDYRPNVPDELQEMIDGFRASTVLDDLAEQNAAMESKLNKLENTVKILASGMQELELGIAYLIADRKGLTRESANLTLGGKGINMLEESVPQTMDRMHEQTRQYLNMKRLQEGRRTTPPK